MYYISSATQKKKSEILGSFAFINSAVAFFVTFFSTKESKERRPLGFHENKEYMFYKNKNSIYK